MEGIHTTDLQQKLHTHTHTHTHTRTTLDPIDQNLRKAKLRSFVKTFYILI